MIPLYGKVADIRGRAFALRIAIVVHLAGSLLCALAPSMLVLILGRSLQGIGDWRFRGLRDPVTLFQVDAPDLLREFPPPRSATAAV